MQNVEETDEQIVKAIEQTGEKLVEIRNAVGQVIFGQQPVVEQTLTAILAGGTHC